MHPFVYLPHERLTPAELSAARLDGHLVELGEGYIPADAVETAGTRAASLRGVLGQALAATHLTAAWVHGAVDEPPVRFDVQRAVPHRLHHVIDRRLTYRDVQLEPRNLQRVGGVLVTTPARTLADLARDVVRGRSQPLGHAAVRVLAEAPGLARSAIVALALHDGAPGKRGAIALLRRLERRVGAIT